MAPTPAQTLSVSDALAVARTTLETIDVAVVGEVSDLSDPTRYKAVYFSLGDGTGVLPCMMWRGAYEGSGVQLKAGVQVVVTGRFTLYEAKGRLQFTVRSIELAGEGRLRQEVAQRAEQLRREGLMEPSRKLAVPRMAERIGLITSPSGKAVHDVLRTLRRRFPVAEVLFWGVQVEGESAPPQIVDALRMADGADVDVVLLVRGGGSYEDLMVFSTESVARAVAAMSTPIVTGIGHEPDTSIADMVADLRASTPTAAAEAVTPSLDELTSQLNRERRLLAGALQSRLAASGARLSAVLSRPVITDPSYLTAQRAMRLDGLNRRLAAAIPSQLERDRRSLTHAVVRMRQLGESLVRPHALRIGHGAERLDDLSPLRVLSRGYAAAFAGSDGHVVDSTTEVAVGDSLIVRVRDGDIGCVVETLSEGWAAARPNE